MTREKNVPGNPHECRLNAAHCSELAKTVVTSECQSLLVLADTWKRLAAELEADQSLLQVLSELDLSSQPYEAFLFALNIHPGLKWPSQKTAIGECIFDLIAVKPRPLGLRLQI